MQSPITRLAFLAALASSAVVSMAQTVTPPPLPPGSELVRPEGGLNEEERKRFVRAHHHKMHHRKDLSHDDSVAEPAAGQPGNKPATPPGQAKKK
jgi:hypothetical protein